MSDQLQRLLQIRRLDDNEQAYATAEAFDNHIAALTERVRVLEGLLSRMAWIESPDGDEDASRFCASCGNAEFQGHRPDCELAKALEAK